MAIHANGAPEFASLYPAVARFEDAGEEYERIVRRVYEAVLTDGDTVVDVGAHVGKHSVPMALACGPTGHVLAVEPIDWAIERLRTRIDHAGLSSLMTTYHGCCGDAESEVSFTVVPNHPGWSSIAPRAEVTDSVLVTVPQTTVDLLCAGRDRVRFLKIDVEGAEPLVLRGAEGVLKRFLPIVHVEVIEKALEPFGLTTDDVSKPLLALGYRIIDLLGNDVTDPALWTASSSVPDVADYIAVHPDDPSFDAVLDVLRSSFLTERRNRDVAPAGLLPAPRDGVLSQVSGGWPAPAQGHRDDIVFMGGRPFLRCSAGGGPLELGSPVPVDLPLGVRSVDLSDGRTLEVRIEVDEVPSGRHVTLAELAWSGSALTTVVRLDRTGELEVLWLHRHKTVRVDTAPVAAGTRSFSVHAERRKGVVSLEAVAGTATVRAQAPDAVRPGTALALTVGGRGEARFRHEGFETTARLSMTAGRLSARHRLQEAIVERWTVRRRPGGSGGTPVTGPLR